MEPRDFHEAAIHDVERACFYRNQIQDVDLVELAIGDVYEARDIASKIQEGMKTNGSRQERQAQVDRRGIWGVNCVSWTRATDHPALHLYWAAINPSHEPG
jgi:hypothetical protein